MVAVRNHFSVRATLYPFLALSHRISAARALAGIVAVMVMIDLVWGFEAHLTIRDLQGKAAQLVGLYVLTTIYLSLRPNLRLREMARYVLLWITFSTAAAVLTYLCATLDFPLRDAFFLRCDRALGFSLAGWTHLLQANPAANRVLAFDYNSVVPQIAGTIFWLAHTCTRGRNAEFLSAAILSLLLASLLSALLPALGPTLSDNITLVQPPPYVGEIIAMRAHQALTRSVSELQGIISFPSYHTVLALLITWAHRRLRTFWPIAIVNGLMLFSVPSGGNHYLTDMIGGALVAVVSLLATRLVFLRDTSLSVAGPAECQETIAI